MKASRAAKAFDWELEHPWVFVPQADMQTLLWKCENAVKSEIDPDLGRAWPLRGVEPDHSMRSFEPLPTLEFKTLFNLVTAT